MLTVAIVAGIVMLGAVGVVSRRPRTLDEWTVNGRSFNRWTSWFLQAGESLTTFSFLGLAGVAFSGGASATFAIAYLSISTIGLYFVAPRLWKLGRDHKYLTQADFFADRFNSRLFGKVTAIVGSLFLLPYLQLQITGLGLIVELATGSSAGRGLSMVVASALTVIFVTWAGIKGVARVAVVKDILMVAALTAVVAGVSLSVAGIPEIFSRVNNAVPQLLTLDSSGYGSIFFLTAVIVTGLGSGLNTFPHLFPPVFSAKSSAVLRSNYVWLALYQLLLFAPIIVGLSAILTLDERTSGNTVLLTISRQTLPDWLVALVAVGGASAAMVPAAAIAMGISTLVSHNLLPSRSTQSGLRINAICVTAAVALSLGFGLANSDITSLLLLTFGGLAQLAPATLIALRSTISVGSLPVLLGLLAGVITVTVLSFGDVPIGAWDPGFVALGPNILAVCTAELFRRRLGAWRKNTKVSLNKTGNPTNKGQHLL